MESLHIRYPGEGPVVPVPLVFYVTEATMQDKGITDEFLTELLTGSLAFGIRQIRREYLERLTSDTASAEDPSPGT